MLFKIKEFFLEFNQLNWYHLAHDTKLNQSFRNNYIMGETNLCNKFIKKSNIKHKCDFG